MAETHKTDLTDGRKEGDFLSRYESVKGEIWQEAFWLMAFFIVAFLVIFFTWEGSFISWLNISDVSQITLKKYIYYSAAGLLGGITFGMKYLYRAVARGFWNQDRKLWRFLSPLIALAIAFIIGTLIEANFINGQNSTSGASNVAIGFLAGYFADEAVGKMFEIANVVFGRSKSSES